jgi:hypothetical protein
MAAKVLYMQSQEIPHGMVAAAVVLVGHLPAE